MAEIDRIDEARAALGGYLRRGESRFAGAVAICTPDGALALADAYALAVLEEAREVCYACDEAASHEDADGKTWCRPHVILRDRLMASCRRAPA